MKLQSIFCVSIAILLSSCISTRESKLSTPLYAPSVELNSLKAEIKVNLKKKLKGSATATYFLFFRIAGDNKYTEGINYSSNSSLGIDLSILNPFKLLSRILNGDAEGKVRAAAAYNAMSNSDADILVHPQYSMTVENYLIIKKLKSEVSGYPAHFTAIKQEEDFPLILDGDDKAIIIQSIEEPIVIERGGSRVKMNIDIDSSSDK